MNLFQSSTPQMRLALMASHLSTSTAAPRRSPSISVIPKSNIFTSKLPPDPKYPAPEFSHLAPRAALLPRQVKGGLYTFVRPTAVEAPQLLAVSSVALRDLNLAESAVEEADFVDVVSGNRILGWEDIKDGGEGKMEKNENGDDSALSQQPTGEKERNKIYPWAQNYGGFQFGNWASQLGDGRALSLFETTNPSIPRPGGLGLRGAGLAHGQAPASA